MAISIKVIAKTIVATGTEPTTTPIIELTTKGVGKAIAKAEVQLSATLTEIAMRAGC